MIKLNATSWHEQWYFILQFYNVFTISIHQHVVVTWCDLRWRCTDQGHLAAFVVVFSSLIQREINDLFMDVCRCEKTSLASKKCIFNIDINHRLNWILRLNLQHSRIFFSMVIIPIISMNIHGLRFGSVGESHSKSGGALRLEGCELWSISRVLAEWKACTKFRDLCQGEFGEVVSK